MQHLINEAKCSGMQLAPSMHQNVYLGECITMQVNVAGWVNAAKCNDGAMQLISNEL